MAIGCSSGGRSCPTPDRDLSRFVEAQDDAGTFAAALEELRSGRKRSHWMWFVFPQLDGLGRSATARHFGIAGRAEAQAYLEHPVLGPRLAEATDAVLGNAGRAKATDIFGATDTLKLKSSMTLFDVLSEPENRFARVLEAFYNGERDRATLGRL